MNLHIIRMEGNDLLWRLSDNLDGVCYVRDGRVETPQLLDDSYVDLRPCTIREIRKQCQEWVDAKPERDKEAKEWNNRYDYYRALWETWEDHEGVKGRNYQAVASIYHEPDEIAVQGECRFTAYDEEGRMWRSTLYNNPTWADVMRAFEESMEHTDDYHHVFLEGVHKTEFSGEYGFSTGS